MRETIGYQAVLGEMADEEPTDADAATPAVQSGSPAEGAASPDPTREERAYPDLPGEGTKR